MALSGGNEPLECCNVCATVANTCQLRARDHLDHLIHFLDCLWLLAHEAMPALAVHVNKFGAVIQGTEQSVQQPSST